MVEDLIRRARQRLILNESLGQSAFAAAVGAAGFALLLILGTSYLQWWTIAVFAAAGLAIGIYRVANRLPDPYSTAVRLDENARLQDTLSTAVHFSAADSRVSDEFRRSQYQQAEAAAGTVTLKSAVPFTFPPAFYATAALCLLASGLIGLRYRAGRGIDLRRPITEVLFEDQAARATAKQVSLQNSKPGAWTDQAENLLAKLGIKPSPGGPTPGDPDVLDKAIEKAMQQPGAPDAKDSKSGDSEKAAQGKEGATKDNSAGGDPIDGGEKSGGDAKENSENGSKEGDPGSKGKPGDAGKESLMSKLKDAVSSMLSKAKPDQKQAEQKSAEQKSAQGEQRKGEKKGDSGEGKPKDANGDSDSDDAEPKSDAQGGEKGQGKESTASNKQQSQSGSGIGSQDGSKELKMAEQLKAMGKISEIIGKRSATVSGETSVEVESGNQALHTSYSNSSAAHAETDGDVTRDEIPVALQGYVQQYFQEVRKAGGKKPGPATRP